jgi:hypothetical protein
MVNRKAACHHPPSLCGLKCGICCASRKMVVVLYIPPVRQASSNTEPLDSPDPACFAWQMCWLPSERRWGTKFCVSLTPAMCAQLSRRLCHEMQAKIRHSRVVQLARVNRHRSLQQTQCSGRFASMFLQYERWMQVQGCTQRCATAGAGHD